MDIKLRNIWDTYGDMLDELGISLDDVTNWVAKGYDLTVRPEGHVLWENIDAIVAFVWDGQLYSFDKLRGEQPGDSQDNPFHN